MLPSRDLVFSLRRALDLGAILLPACALVGHGRPSIGPAPVVGDRTFLARALEQQSQFTANAAIGDLGNGHPDIVLAKGRHWHQQSVVLLGDGHGNFTPGPPLPNGPQKTYCILLADLRKTGHLDLVLSGDAPSPKQILLNQGAGHFAQGGTYGEPSWGARNADVGALTPSGFPDLAISGRGGPTHVCFNDGTANFSCRVLGPESSSSVLIRPVVSTLNDIVVPCRDTCQSVIYVNDGQGHFPRTIPFGPVASTRAIAVGDFTGSGRLDIAAYHSRGEASGLGLFIYYNLGDGTFSPGVEVLGPSDLLPYSMIAADLRNTGRADLVVGFTPTPQVKADFSGLILANDGSGRHFAPTPFGDGEGAVYGLATGDLTGSGFLDIVVARSGAPSFVLFNRRSR